MRRVLVARVGNVLPGDDGFGVAVADHLSASGLLPAGVDLIETGIGGMAIVQQLADGHDAHSSLLMRLIVAPPLGPCSCSSPRFQSRAHSISTIGALASRTSIWPEPARVFVLARASGSCPMRSRSSVVSPCRAIR